MNLNFNKETGDFEVKINHDCGHYNITLVDFESDGIAEATDLAKLISNWLNINLENVKRFTASALIELKNDSWLEEDEEHISEDIFIKTIELDGILAFSDGSFEIYFNDNDLFFGHSIKVDVNQSFKLESADVWG